MQRKSKIKKRNLELKKVKKNQTKNLLKVSNEQLEVRG